MYICNTVSIILNSILSKVGMFSHKTGFFNFSLEQNKSCFFIDHLT
jgi:hypothetical protein